MATAAPASKKQTVKALKVVSRSPMGNIRRAGMLFGTEPTTVALSALSKAQVEAIKAEPLLIVSETTVELEDPTEGSAA